MQPQASPTLILIVRVDNTPAPQLADPGESPPRGLVIEYRSESVSLSGVMTSQCADTVRRLLERDLRALTAAGARPGRDLLLWAAVQEPVA